ncbi:MAG TPA: hypothetical protein VFY66_07005, partial [Anaerolineales bacterium]|nr:hypothetical protein [Anaerolineales bacterium]
YLPSATIKASGWRPIGMSHQTLSIEYHFRTPLVFPNLVLAYNGKGQKSMQLKWGGGGASPRLLRLST